MPDSTLRFSRWLVVILLGLLCVRIAWVSDDALITLRSALNITHGWGPGFNATEAVQAYTHPLWFLLWVAIGALTNEWIIGILALSVLATCGAVGIAVWHAKSVGRVLIVAGMLALSNAFMEYSSSGLENPLAYLLVGVLFALTIPALGSTSDVGRTWPWAALVGLTSAALVLTRMDLALLILVPLLAVAWAHRRHWQLLGIMGTSAAAPLLVWFTWSKATYATWLPNTFEAKRNLDIPTWELVIQGLRYLYISLEHDPVTALVLAAGLLLGLTSRRRLLVVWSLGAALYLGYVLIIGGDFMAGRFLAVPVYVAALVLAVAPNPFPDPHRDPLVGVIFALVLLVTLGLASAGMNAVPTSLSNPQERRWDSDTGGNAGVSDERGVYVANGRAFKAFVNDPSSVFYPDGFVPIGDGSGLNRDLHYLDHEAKIWPTTTSPLAIPTEVGQFCGFLGTVGLVTGPTTHLVDRCALTDRYLASKTYTPTHDFAWKPGHFERAIPDGYLDAIRANDPALLKDPAQAFYLKRLWDEIRPSA